MRYVQPHNPCEYPYPWPSDLYRSEAGPGAEQVPEIDIREVDHGDEGYLGELMGDTQIQPGLLAPPPYSEYPVEVNPVEPGSYIMVRGSSAGSNYAMGGFIYDSGERAMGGFVEEVSEQPEYGQASWEHQQQHEQQHQGQYSHGDTQLTADEQQRVWREQWDQQQQQQRLQQQEEQRQQLQATWGAAYVQQRPPPAYTSHSSVYPNATYRVADAFAHAGPSSLGAVHEGVAYEGAYPTYEEAAYPAYQETYPREVAAGRTSGGGGPPKRERQQSQQSHTSSSSGGKSKPPKKQQKK
ncbi:hypothetical protein F5Y16DRAFT_131195 [Xylariaceae sp. FL0255]|nr:hypothetical protein F5Y16DRAFT_131195 [Xylariaceae sp. FL0255]